MLFRTLCCLALVVLAWPARRLEAAVNAYDVMLPVAFEFSDCLVFGRIVGTRPFSDSVPERVCLLVVDETFTPHTVVGDTIAVLWAANVWHPTAQSTAIEASGFGPQLADMEQLPALWVLDRRIGADGQGGFGMSVAPYELTRENLEALRGAIRLSETPTPGETEQIDRGRSQRAEYMQLGLAALESNFAKRRAVVERLKQVVAGLEGSANGR